MTRSSPAQSQQAAHQQAKRLANSKPLNSSPTGHGDAHLVNNQKRNRCNCHDALPNPPLSQAEKVREEQKKREGKPPPQWERQRL